jgi:transcriptional regulator with XRE-family HTH domain
MPVLHNIVGPRLRALRLELGLTQAMLAARCGTLGWDIGENTVTKIETRVRCVTDVELVCMAAALDVDPTALLPAKDELKTIASKYFRGRRRE